MKSLFDTESYNEVLTRLNALTPQSQAKWGKMNVSQMMAHCCNPLETGLGEKQVKSNFILRTIGPLFKKALYEDKPFKRSLPTAAAFVVNDERDFEKEKQKLTGLIKKFHEDQGTVVGSKKHPIFGAMTKAQWAQSNYKHLDHHLQQFGA
jgi:hypothetical protein